MTPALNYRELLKREFVAKTHKNSKYSLRAFARDLDVSCAFISQVLNEHRHLSERKGNQIGRALKWNGTRRNLLPNDSLSKPPRRSRFKKSRLSKSPN